METSTKVNKAQEKREKDAVNAITQHLTRKLVDFKERFLKSYVEYRFSEFDRAIADRKKQVYDEKQLRYHYTLEAFQKDQTAFIARVEAQKALVFTNTHKFIVEAEENYTGKFNKLVRTLVDYGVKAYPLEIERISAGTVYDFSFLVRHNEIEVHARIIFACGEINVPHYRFIITKRGK